MFIYIKSRETLIYNNSYHILNVPLYKRNKMQMNVSNLYIKSLIVRYNLFLLSIILYIIKLSLNLITY